MKKACQLDRVSSRDCLGHGLHNLLMVDGYELEKERLEEQNSLNEMIDVATEVDEYLRIPSYQS